MSLPLIIESVDNRPFWRYISILQMTEYPSQPRVHLINSSDRNCSEIR